MDQEKNNRIKIIQTRVNQAEFITIKSVFSKTTFNKMSEYFRAVLLRKPITILHRNKSLDEFMAVMEKLRDELNSIGSNYNQTVKKLNALQSISDIKAWLLINENSKQILFEKISEIKLKIMQIHEKWLQ